MPPSKQKTPSGRRTNGRYAALVPLSVWIACVVVFLMRIGSWEYFSDAPLYQENYPKYFYTSEIASDLLKDQGAFWGYDPNFAAGLLINPGGSTIAYGLLAVLCAATGLPATIILKLLIAIFFVAFPWLIYLSARRFGLSVTQSAAVMALDAVMNFYSLRYRSIHASMGMFYTATPIVLYVSAVLFSSDAKRGLRPYAAMLLVGAAGALLVYWHILQAGLLALASLLHVIQRRDIYLKAKNFPSLVMAVGIVWLASLPWLIPFLKFQWEVIPFHDVILNYTNIEWLRFKAFLLILITLLHPLTLSAMIATIAARPWRRFRKNSFGYLYLFAALCTLLAAALSFTLFGRLMTAMRFLDIVPACLFIVMLAGRRRAPARRGIFRRNRRALIMASIAATQGILAVAMDFTPSFRNEPGPDYLELEHWIVKDTDGSARIAIETTGKAGDQPLAFAPVSLLAKTINRQWAALPSLESANILYYAYLYEGQLGPHDLAAMSEEKLDELMELYNIGWVIALSDKTKRVLEKHHDNFELIHENKFYSFFQVLRTHNYFLYGGGKILSRTNGLELSELAPDESGRIAISYHYYPCMEANGKTKITMLPSSWDSIGFMEIHTDESSVDIRCDARQGFRSLPEGYTFRSSQ